MTIAPQRHETPRAIELQAEVDLEDVDPGLRVVVQRIHSDHPEVDVVRVRSLVLDAHAETEHAPVQNFRLVLAERSVRAILRAERRTRRIDPA